MSTQAINVNVTAIVRKTLSDQPVLCVRSTETDGPAAGEAIAEAWAAREHQGLESAGPPYLTSAETGGWEAGVPVATTGVPEGRVVPGVLPGGEVASAYYAGSIYDSEQVEAVVANLRTQLEAAGLEPAGPLRWIYLTDPEQTPDPGNHYTELHWPVRS
ncbi:GyrI-like domain-containing protein [Flindersiella endophytica]